jgi:hypothetical protein
LIELAAKHNVTSLCRATRLVYTGASQKNEGDRSSRGGFGDIYYFDSVPVNLASFSMTLKTLSGISTPHDLSVMIIFLGVVVRGRSQPSEAAMSATFSNDIAYLTLELQQQSQFAHFHRYTWLAPMKIRKTLIGGTKSMIIYYEPIQKTSEKVKIYDKGLDVYVARVGVI